MECYSVGLLSRADLKPLKEACSFWDGPCVKSPPKPEWSLASRLHISMWQSLVNQGLSRMSVLC